MGPYYWNDWYSGWGWVLWFGMVFLFVSIMGNYSYTYRAHRKYEGLSSAKTALDILNERYARGEINHEEFMKMKSNIVGNEKVAARRVG
jgi:putative membrane protein